MEMVYETFFLIAIDHQAKPRVADPMNEQIFLTAIETVFRHPEFAIVRDYPPYTADPDLFSALRKLLSHPVRPLRLITMVVNLHYAPLRAALHTWRARTQKRRRRGGRTRTRTRRSSRRSSSSSSSSKRRRHPVTGGGAAADDADDADDADAADAADV
jgi:hypothetical protein